MPKLFQTRQNDLAQCCAVQKAGFPRVQIRNCPANLNNHMDIVRRVRMFFHLCSRFRFSFPLQISVQRVPEPDPIPIISFDTRPDPIHF